MSEEPTSLEETSLEIPSQDTTLEEIRAHHRLRVCIHCREKHPYDVPCEDGTGCQIFPPLSAAEDEGGAELPAAARRRGAPLGNTNALTHGYYSRKLRDLDALELDEYAFRGLKEETRILRYFIRRVVEQTASGGGLEDSFHHLRAVSLAIISLTRLLRTEVILTEQEEKEEAARFDRHWAQVGLRDRLAQLTGNDDFKDPEDDDSDFAG